LNFFWHVKEKLILHLTSLWSLISSFNTRVFYEFQSFLANANIVDCVFGTTIWWHLNGVGNIKFVAFTEIDKGFSHFVITSWYVVVFSYDFWFIFVKNTYFAACHHLRRDVISCVLQLVARSNAKIPWGLGCNFIYYLCCKSCNLHKNYNVKVIKKKGYFSNPWKFFVADRSWEKIWQKIFFPIRN